MRDGGVRRPNKQQAKFALTSVGMWHSLATLKITCIWRSPTRSATSLQRAANWGNGRQDITVLLGIAAGQGDRLPRARRAHLPEALGVELGLHEKVGVWGPSSCANQTPLRLG